MKALPQLPMYLKFWKFEDRFRLYLDQSIEQECTSSHHFQPHRQGITLIIVIYVMTHALLVVVPFSARTRLMLHDLILFYNLPQTYNWIFVLFGLDSLFFQLTMNRSVRHPIALRLLRSILYHGHDRGFFFSIEQVNKPQQLIAMVNAQSKRIFSRLRYFALYAGYLLSFYHVNSARRVAQDWRYYLTDMFGIPSLTLLMVTNLITDVQIITFTLLHCTWVATAYLFTKLTFTQLNNLNRFIVVLARGGGDGSQKSGFGDRLNEPNQCVHWFIYYHTRTLVTVTRFNHTFGTLLLVFMLTNVPISTYMALGVMLGRFAPITVTIFANFLLMQAMIFGTLHLMAANYTARIHRCCPALFRLQVLPSVGLDSVVSHRPLTRRTRVRVWLVVDRFHTTHRYGITYGPFGLMTIGSFVHFLFMYGEFILYWYRLIQ